MLPQGAPGFKGTPSDGTGRPGNKKARIIAGLWTSSDFAKPAFGGGMVPRTKRLLKVRDTGILASCEVLRTGAKSGG
jgi:hypothetical protein